MLLTPRESMLLIKRTVNQLDYRISNGAVGPIHSNVGYGLRITCRDNNNHRGRRNCITLYVGMDSVTLNIPKNIARFGFTGMPLISTSEHANISLFIPGTSLRIRGTLANGLASCTIVRPNREQLVFLARLIVSVVADQSV